jgi:insulysin
MALPPRNNLIPTSFEIHSMTSKFTLTPSLLHSTQNSRIRHIQCNKFNTPDVALWLKIYSNDKDPNYTQKSTSLRRLWVLMFNEKFRDFSYLVEMDGSGVSLSNFANGVSLNVSCYDQKLEMLLEEVLNAFVGANLLDDRILFENLKAEQLKNLRNFRENSPYKRVNFYMDRVFSERLVFCVYLIDLFLWMRKSKFMRISLMENFWSIERISLIAVSLKL